MFHYSPSSRSQGYAPYLPRRSNFSASFDIDDTPSPAYALEDLGYPPLSQSFVPRPMNAETRYRRALYELEAAEQEYQNHIALEARARQMAAIRQRAAAEAARRERERETALYAEIERINHTRAFQEQVEERFAQRQRGLRTQVGFDGAHRGRHAFMGAVHGDAEGDSALRRHCVHPQVDNETLTIGDLLGLFAGAHSEPQRASQRQRPTSPPASQPRQPTEPHTQPQPPERENAEVNLGSILEFFQSIATQARGAAAGEQSTQESFASQPEARPVDGKGKAKAKAEPVPEPSFLETLLHGRGGGAHDQELRDLEYAIKLSLQDRDATDAKKAHPLKASQSSSGASSYKVKVEDPSSSGRAASPTRNATFASVPAPVPEPVSPLTSVRAVRTQFSALESSFKFPPVLNFEHSELAVTPNNAPVRAYEYALNGLLERLDAIESDGDEEVRDVRREVVREVERALEEVERKVKEQAPVPEVTKQEATNVESEGPGATPSQAVPSADVRVTEAAKPTPPELAPVASQADTDIGLAISAEYQSASRGATTSGVVDGERDSAEGTAPANGEASTLSGGDAEAVPASEDTSDSVATITAASVAPVVPAHSSSNKSDSSSAAAETFLTSLSHDQFTFPPRPTFSQSNAKSGVPQDDDAVLVDNSSEGGLVKSVDDGWTTEF